MITAGPEHAAALAAIHAAAFPAAQAWGETDFAAQLRLPGVAGLIHPDGGMVLIRVVAEEAEVLTLGVAPAARRRGIGRSLLREALSLAAAHGAGTAFLEVAEDNAAALALYGEAGFRPLSRRSAYYPGGVDALIMTLPLLQPGIESLNETATVKRIVGNHESFCRALRVVQLVCTYQSPGVGA